MDQCDQMERIDGKMDQREIDEWIKGINDGTKSLDEAPMEIVDLFLNSEVATEEETAHQETEEAKTEPEAKEVEQNQTEAEQDTQESAPEDDEKWYKQRNYELANELNTVKQRMASHERKLKEDPLYRETFFKDQGLSQASTPVKEEAVKNFDNVDVYDEDFQKKQARELSELKATVSRYEKERESRQLEERMTSEQNQRVSKVQAIEEKIQNTKLKTEQPFSELNKLIDAGITDPARLKSHGVSQGDIDKLGQIYQIANAHDDFGYGLYSAGIPTIQQSTPEQVARQMLADKKNQIEKQTETITTPRGEQGFAEHNRGNMTEDQASGIIRQLGQKEPSMWSADERQNYEMALQALGV